MFPLPPTFPYYAFAPGVAEDEREQVLAAYLREQERYCREVDLDVLTAGAAVFLGMLFVGCALWWGL